MVNSTAIWDFLSSSPKIGFDRTKLLDALKDLAHAYPAVLNDSEFFYHDSGTTSLQNSPTAPIITLRLCTAICGSSIFNKYPDAATRLSTWLFPTLLLLAGLQYAPVGWRKVAMVPHLLADPIHSNWSLLSKVETMNRCLAMARKLSDEAWLKEEEQNVGLIISCMEELFGGLGGEMSLNSHSQRGIVGLSSDPVKKRGPNDGVDEVAIEVFKSKGPIATILETDFSEDQGSNRILRQGFGINQTPFCSCRNPPLHAVYAKTAQSIIDTRVGGVLQTTFSIGVYISLGVVAAFVPDFGGNPLPSGGKIVTFILLSWLLPTILSSNMVGQFSTSRSCLDALITFKERLEELVSEREDLNSGCCGERAKRWISKMKKFTRQDWLAYSTSLAENGGIYSFRIPEAFPLADNLLPVQPLALDIFSLAETWICKAFPAKILCKLSVTHSAWMLTILSVLPVTTSFIAAFIVLWSVPTYFSCRHVMIICIYFTWILSFLFTKFITSIRQRTLSTKQKFYIIFVKDTILTSAILGVLIGSACGLFSSCFCWSGWWYLRWWTSEPQVQVMPNKQFQENVKWVYPLVVALCMVAQLLWFCITLWTGRKVYFGMMQRNDRWLWDVVLKRTGATERHLLTKIESKR